MANGIQPGDLGFLCVLARAGSLSAAARELGITTPALSKHLAAMEARAGVALVNRTTRRMSLTPEGELVLQHARRILGEIAVNWALDGHGILMRAEWDVERFLKSGRLVQVLPQFHTPDADIYAVYPQRHQHAARVRAFVEFVAAALAPEETGRA